MKIHHLSKTIKSSPIVKIMMGDTNVIVFMVGPGMVFIVKLFVLRMAIALMISVKRSNVNLVLLVTVIIVVITMRSVEFKGMPKI